MELVFYGNGKDEQVRVKFHPHVPLSLPVPKFVQIRARNNKIISYSINMTFMYRRFSGSHRYNYIEKHWIPLSTDEKKEVLDWCQQHIVFPIKITFKTVSQKAIEFLSLFADLPVELDCRVCVPHQNILDIFNYVETLVIHFLHGFVEYIETKQISGLNADNWMDKVIPSCVKHLNMRAGMSITSSHYLMSLSMRSDIVEIRYCFESEVDIYTWDMESLYELGCRRIELSGQTSSINGLFTRLTRDTTFVLHYDVVILNTKKKTVKARYMLGKQHATLLEHL
jgi:hypothetical protein